MHTQAYQNLYLRIYNWAKALPTSTSSKEVQVMNCAFGSSGGGVRSSNEDQLVVVKTNVSSSPQNSFSLYAVLDGMGGMKEGAECARIALSSFVTSLVLSTQLRLEEKIAFALERANREVFDRFRGNGGTTIAALVTNQLNEAVMVNVGDSRVYEFSYKDRYIKQLSIDDTLGEALANWGPKNLENSNQLIQFVGMGSGLMVPHIKHLAFGFDDKAYVVATDGAFKMPDGVVEGLLSHASSSKEVVQRLIRTSEWLGGFDNSSAICIWPGSSKSINESHPINSVMLYGVQDSLEIQGQVSIKNHDYSNTVITDNTPLLAEQDDLNLFKEDKNFKLEKNTSKKKKTATKKQKRSGSLVEIKLLDE